MTVWGLALGGLLAPSGCSNDRPDAATGAQLEGPAAAEPSTAEGPGRALLLRFGGAEPGEVLESFRNSGWSAVRVEVVTGGSGRVLGADSPRGTVARFPAYAEGNPEFAMLSVVNEGIDDILGVGQDVLSPGERAFVFGADVALDAVTVGDPADDGDNLVQRGLFGGPSQYKIQVDDGRPSCMVRGLAGELLVVAETRLTPRDWYRVRCRRHQDTLRLQVARLWQDGRGEWSEYTSSGPLGPVIMPSRTPLSVAGKLAGDGTLVPASTDQLNGRLDRVLFDVLE